MLDRRLSRPCRKTPRRWRLAAVLTRDPGDPFDAYSVLRETPGDFGLVLWQAVRDVDLWAGSPSNREALFQPGAGARRHAILALTEVPPALVPAVALLTALVSHPGEALPDALSLACARVANWALEQSATATALAFAQAASMVLPKHGRPALEVGRIAFLRGDRARAETWLRRAIGLARTEGDGRTYALACAELGDLYAVHGDADRARSAYVRALRTARRFGAYPVRGRALHGIGRLELRAGRLAEAGRLFWRAAKPLTDDVLRAPALAHDLAEVAVRLGRYADAAPSLRELLVSRAEPTARVRTLALLALCAAHARQLPALSELWGQAWPLVENIAASGDSAVALIDLARAAAFVGNRHLSRSAAERALRCGNHIGQESVALEAQRLLSTDTRATHGAFGANC